MKANPKLIAEIKRGSEGYDYHVGYVDQDDWMFELGAAMDGVLVFPSLDTLDASYKCSKRGRGVVKVLVVFEIIALEEDPIVEDYHMNHLE